MAGGKKKKKPASNPARGFATTSVASKTRADISDESASIKTPIESDAALGSKTAVGGISSISPHETENPPKFQLELSPDDFEKQLEESELQALVEKYSQKSNREAGRQITRLQTDRRLLRSHADPLITRKWLPSDLMEEFLSLIIEDDSLADSPIGHDKTATPRPISEEDLTIKLWTLQQTLDGAGFPECKVKLALHYILGASDKIMGSIKDSIWGLEESLEWLARECSKDELPNYETSQKKSQASKTQTESPAGGPAPSGTNTPKRVEEVDIRHTQKEVINVAHSTHSSSNQVKEMSNPKRPPTKYDDESDSDMDPDELLPAYLKTKIKLFHLFPPMQTSNQTNGEKVREAMGEAERKGNSSDPEITKLQRRLQKIQGDILFDQYIANKQWERQRIQLQRDDATVRSAASGGSVERIPHPAEIIGEYENEISREATRIGAEVLTEDASDDEGAIVDLFASLPVTEIDPVTGKSNVMINGSDGKRVILRDFGKSIGVSPRRVFEDACKARDPTVKITYALISEATFSNRHSIRINWSKAQENLPISSPYPGVDCASSPKTTTISMKSISTPNKLQSESYISTAALFLVFSTSVREEKVFLRLPPAWRDLWLEFLSLKKEQTDSADREAIRALRDSIREKRDREEKDGVILATAFKRRGALMTSNDTSDESGPEKGGKSWATNENLQRIWTDKSQSPAYQKMLKSRMQLPMWSFKDEVLRTIEREPVVIICGETGCGKSTQVPSFVLGHQLSEGKPCKIYCTEPRRISAISLARRVSEELGERRNDLGSDRSLVGYAIRLESNTARETRLVYATTGIVMRMLEGSNDLHDVTHIILDEVHERTIDSDFLLIILRKIMSRRPDLKVILMSATVDSERFSKYLDGAPVLQVPGRTFPVTSMFLEDAIELTGYSVDKGYQEKKYTDLDDDVDVDGSSSTGGINPADEELRSYSSRTRNTLTQIDEYQIEYELIQQLMISIATDERFIKYSKAILVFLPGIAEIRQLNDMLLGHPVFSSKWYVYPLHSTIASEDQEAAFLVPPEGTRKIVLATNIAETGITIPDVTCVIDTGKHREMRFDERRQLSRLLETFISKANAKQRRGRAGRVQEGLCVHLFTKHRHDCIMPEQQTPEMLRLSLQDLAIRVKICKLGGIEETLNQALDPPLPKNIRRAIDALIDVRALTAAEELTPLGLQLARLPLDVFLGKLILLGAIFKCLDVMITIAAIISSKSPFSAPFGARTQADMVKRGFRRGKYSKEKMVRPKSNVPSGDSDLLTVFNAYVAWKRVCNTNASEFQFCRKTFLSPQTLSNIEDLKGQLITSLVDSGFLPLTEAEKANLNKVRFSSGRHQFFETPQRSNVNHDNDLITSSVIAWSFYPKILTRDGKGWRNVANNQSISIHPSSVNKGHHELQWLSYYHIMQAKQFYNAHETTAVTDFAIALLCGDVRCDLYSGVITLDGNRARFAISDWKTMLVIKSLRAKLKDIMTRNFKLPGKALTRNQARWLELWQKVFSQKELLQAKGYGPKT